MKVNKWFYYLIWMLIAIVLLYVSNVVLQKTGNQASENFNYTGSVWAGMLVPFLFGIHLSFLLGWPKKFHMNVPLLALVWLPSFAVLCYPILAISFEIHYMKFFLYTTERATVYVSGMISGLALMKSLFTHQIDN